MTRFKHSLLFSWIILCISFGNSIKAQSYTFIHIQSENNKAYFVQWKENTYPSSTNGYLVIPQVPAGNHTLTFGFEDTSLPKYSFTVTIDEKPRGFSLKQSVNNTWSLLDMVSFTVNKGSEQIKENKPELVINKPVDPEKKQLPVPDTTLKPLPASVINVEKPAVIRSQQSNELPIQKTFDKANSAGIDQVYIIINKEKADTIAIFIPILKEEPTKQSAFKPTGSDGDTHLFYQPNNLVYLDRSKLSLK